MNLKYFYLSVALIFMLASESAYAARGGATANEAQPPQIYTDRARQMLDRLVAESLLPENQPLTENEQDQFKEMMRNRDNFLYSPHNELKISNKTIPINVRASNISNIKLSHTFTTTLVFSDAAGNPWDVELLTDVSNSDVVSVSKRAPHIIAIRPLKHAGKTNLPVKLAGEQRPLMFLFDISDEEVYFTVDIQVESLGNHVGSQQMRSLSQYKSGERVSARLTPEPEKDMMLQFLTPEGYEERRLYDEYGREVDDRDFVAWSHGGLLYVLTPHDSFTPSPQDIYAASDGRHTLFEYPLLPVVSMRKNSKIFMLYLR